MMMVAEDDVDSEALNYMYLNASVTAFESIVRYTRVK
jgi:hypothetical protein